VTDRLTFIVTQSEGGRRLDRFLAEHVAHLSRSQLQRLIRARLVLLNGLSVRAAEQVAPGDTVTVTLPDEAVSDAPAPGPAIPLTVIHEDESVIVVNKPAGQVVHPAAGHSDDTLVNALVARYHGLSTVFAGERPGIVHRLDRDTSGVLVVARTLKAADDLRSQFRDRTVKKVYLALAKGTVHPPEGIIDAPIGRDSAKRKQMAAVADGRPSRTVYRVLGSVQGYSWLELQPETGRTHQIRVHLAAIGHPVVSDDVYGKRDPIIGRTALHASRLGFRHPQTTERVEFSAPVPEDLAGALIELGLA
jgi:23S rRNA pseudouridine1911/1915/1917 synthase